MMRNKSAIAIRCRQTARSAGTAGKTPSDNAGLTLIDLVVTIAIVAIVLTFGVPSFKNIINNNRMTSRLNEFITVLNLSRSEAIKRRATVTLCVPENATTCDTDSADWGNGWRVFVDLNGNGVFETSNDGDNSNDDVWLQTSNGLVGGTTQSSTGFTNAGRIQYTGRGRIDAAGSFVFCDSRGAGVGSAININLAGRPRLATDDDNDGTVNLNSGGELTCS